MGNASDNLKVLGDYSDRMLAGDTAAVFDFWSPDFKSHVTDRVNPEVSDTDVRPSEQEWWDQARTAFPDMTFEVNLLIESGDLIVSNWSLKGTHTGGPFFEVEPSGERVEINGTAILRMEGGQIVEHWGGPHCQKGLGLIQ
jgi:predicted ester cyclase